MTWLTDIGLDIQTGMEYTGGQEKYLSAVGRFYRNYDKNKAKVDVCFAGQNWNDYMITVHALKSNAKMIGAGELSTHFEELELAARNNETALIEAKNAQTMQKYAELIDKLKPIADLGEIHAADEIGADKAKEIAAELMEALDDFDDELAKELVKKLSGYPFRITQKNKLKAASGYIEDFMYDEAIDLIKEITPAIE